MVDAKPVGKEIRRPNFIAIGLGLMSILVLLAVARWGVGYYMGVSGGSLLDSAGRQVGATVAKATLLGAITSADAYAATHDGSYFGMDGLSLAAIDGSQQWAIGGPQKGKIAVTAVTPRSFTLVYTDQAGAEYRVVKDESEIVMTDEAGNLF